MMGGLVTISTTDDTFGSEIKSDIRQNDGTLQSLTILTLSSQPLVKGDQFGSLLATDLVMVPR